jgi:hypothetical protein
MEDSAFLNLFPTVKHTSLLWLCVMLAKKSFMTLTTEGIFASVSYIFYFFSYIIYLFSQIIYFSSFIFICFVILFIFVYWATAVAYW